MRPAGIEGRIFLSRNSSPTNLVESWFSLNKKRGGLFDLNGIFLKTASWIFMDGICRFFQIDFGDTQPGQQNQFHRFFLYKRVFCWCVGQGSVLFTSQVKESRKLLFFLLNLAAGENMNIYEFNIWFLMIGASEVFINGYCTCNADVKYRESSPILFHFTWII